KMTRPCQPRKFYRQFWMGWRGRATGQRQPGKRNRRPPSHPRSHVSHDPEARVAGSLPWGSFCPSWCSQTHDTREGAPRRGAQQGSPMELARNLKVESVGRLQPPAPLCLGPRQSVAEAVALMRQHQVGCVLVCEGGQLLGLFTERDLL